MIKLKILLILLLSTLSFASHVDTIEDTKYTDILSHSEIYIDKTQRLTIDDILKKDITFKKNSKKLLGFGYSTKFNVWVRFSITNNSNKAMHKILEFNNALTNVIEFYSPKNNYKPQIEGFLHVNKNRNSTSPIFHINLEPNEKQTFYIKTNSKFTTLIIKLKLWDKDEFYKKELKHQIILGLFFGAMSILALYNIFIFFFSKDINYLYYVFYVVTILFHHVMYVGIGGIYLFNQTITSFLMQNAAILFSTPILALSLFVKSFLRIKDYYPKINKLLNIAITITFISVLFFTFTDDYDRYKNILPTSLLGFIYIITIYALIKKNKQSYYIFFGLTAIAFAILFIVLSSMGIFNIYKYNPYYVEISLVFEASLFSIALAHKIKQLQHETEIAHKELINQKVTESARLEEKVIKKTKDLQKALDEKQLLLKELHHRVKNNMQTIISLIRLQKDKLPNNLEISNVLVTIQNRVSAMGHLHELLYKQDSVSEIDAKSYFELVLSDIKNSYNDDVKLEVNIETKLKIEQAIHCGLILNELVTNSYKYAFNKNQKDKKIKVELYLNELNQYVFSIQDNGIGFDINSASKSTLGLILVNALSKKQLKGNINLDFENGTKVTIKWLNS
ncbi:7TM diverse intracellular signaling domain-containing protein [Sulfurospirillum sp. 1307]